MAARALDAARTLSAAGAPVCLLLSGIASPYGRRTIIATDPDEVIVAPAGSVRTAADLLPVHADAPGLWIGAVAYDAALPVLGLASRHRPVGPSVLAARHPVWATLEQGGDWRVSGPAGPARRRLEAALAGRATAEPASERPAAATGVATSSLTRARYAARCREVQRQIAEGEAFEVNLAQIIEAPWTLGGLALFERLHARSPGDHSAYLGLGDVELASISPELFLRVEAGVVEARPIKGTRPRGRTPGEDVELARDLRASEKDRAENVMIVDLMRNDLTGPAVPGSVEVVELCAVERTTSVMHMVSSVRARLRPGIGAVAALRHCFPPGSVTGAPKRRAIELIDALEEAPRGFYCGTIFAWEPAVDRLVASVAIRTATVSGNTARYGAGGAVTLLSDADEEAEESLVKARPFLEATGTRLAGW